MYLCFRSVTWMNFLCSKNRVACKLAWRLKYMESVNNGVYVEKALGKSEGEFSPRVIAIIESSIGSTKYISVQQYESRCRCKCCARAVFQKRANLKDNSADRSIFASSETGLNPRFQRGPRFRADRAENASCWKPTYNHNLPQASIEGG